MKKTKKEIEISAPRLIIKVATVAILIMLVAYLKNDTEVIPEGMEYITDRGTIASLIVVALGLVNALISESCRKSFIEMKKDILEVFADE